MKRVTTGLLICAGLTGLVSCSNEEGFHGDGSEGRVVLELSADGRVMMNTRADDTKVSVVPEPSDFDILLEKQDGSFSKKFANVDLFNREEGFPIGTYTISAEYGDGENEGFELPHFYGSQEVTVEAGIASYVNLTASLANAMVSVRYTDDFRSRFAAYSTMAKSETGAEAVAFAQNEDRPAYMKPEVIDLRLTLTNSQGDQVTVAPYSFTARPQHHYIVTMGVKENAESGEALLDVQITEEVEAEYIDIPLGDELFTAPVPALNVHDFPAEMRYEEFEAFDVSGDPRIDVLAYGGVKDLNLSIKSGSNTKNYQLVGADASVQNELASAGIEAVGLYTNPDKMAFIKFSKFLRTLPEGTYSVKVDAVDKRGIVSNEVEFSVIIKTVAIDMNIVGHAEYMSDELTVALTSNIALAVDNLRFEALDAKDNWQPAEVLDTRSSVASRAEGDFTYTFKLRIPAPESTEARVRVFYGGSAEPKASAIDANVSFPEYQVETDAFANKVLFKVTATDPAKSEIVRKNFKLTSASNTEYPNLIPYDEENGIFMLAQGITPSTTYDGFESCLSFTNNPHQTIDAFTTEATTDIENGDFSQNSETLLNIPSVQVGGQWKVSPTTYTTTSSILRSTPNGWATLNDLTCWKDSKNKNSWFLVPSTFSENGAVIVRSVGYNHDGKTPATSGGAFNTKYYCENIPTDGDFVKAAGELFLGSYSYDGSEHRNDGIQWDTRPAYLSFDYKYAPVQNEQGEAYIKVIDASGTVISSGEYFIAASENGTAKVALDNYPFGKKAAKIEICFRSTKKDMSPKIVIPGTDVVKHDGDGITNLINSSQRKKGANNYYAFAVGSVLTVDNVRLGYDDSSAPRSNRKDVAIKGKK